MLIFSPTKKCFWASYLYICFTVSVWKISLHSQTFLLPLIDWTRNMHVRDVIVFRDLCYCCLHWDRFQKLSKVYIFRHPKRCCHVDEQPKRIQSLIILVENGVNSPLVFILLLFCFVEWVLVDNGCPFTIMESEEKDHEPATSQVRENPESVPVSAFPEFVPMSKIPESVPVREIPSPLPRKQFQSPL